MDKKFKPLDYSRGWDDYWRDHPQGYSPQEQMINWSGQLNAMIDFFNEYFDVDLTEYATAVMEGWYFDGRLDDIINDVLFDSKADKTTVNALLDETKLRIGWFDEVFTGIRYVAHRGYSAHYPENTLKAYYEASRMGISAWECDPYITSDGVFINMHDETVDVTTNGTGRVEDLTLAQIKALNIDGGNNAGIFKGLKVPTIEEIFELASQMETKPIMFLNSRVALPIDSQKVKDFANIIRKYEYEKRSILLMNDFANWDSIRKELPDIGLCWDQWTTPTTDERLNQIASYAPNVMISFDRSTVLGPEWNSIFQKCKDRGIIVQVQNVQNIDHARLVKNKGVNVIMTDGGFII